jgi:xanthine dehydrogenase YagR molybdenum-binding subunit
MATIIGQPIDRIDGPLKVSGRATYAAEYWNVGQPLYGFIVGATIGKGRISAIDTTRAEQAPGVRLVMTHRNAPKQGKADPSIASAYSRAYPTLDGAEIHHFGEPVALVVAATYEQARAAAKLVDVSYASEPGRYDFAARLNHAYAPKTVNAGLATDSAIGDFDGAFEGAEVTVDQTYTTPYQFAQPLEPHACLAVPNGEDLTIYASAQIVAEARTAIASTLQIDENRIHIVSAFVGGGFGSKLGIHSETILAALAARELQRPVKVVMTRQQIFQLLGLRAMTSQRVRLGATRDGRLVALGHDVTMHTSPLAEYAEQTATSARPMYAAANRLTRHRLVELDLPRGEDVRAPGEAPGLLAFESAIDELATALNIDPVEFRILNEPARHPETGQPFSDRRLVECMREGARRFGWARRPARPGGLRDGHWLIGYGMAAAVRMQFQLPSKATVRMGPDGRVLVRSDITARAREGRDRPLGLSSGRRIRRIVRRDEYVHRRIQRVHRAAREAEKRRRSRGGLGGGGRDRSHVGRAELPELLHPRLRRPVRRSRCGRRYGGGETPADARRLLGRTHFQRENGALSAHRRHDLRREFGTA